MTDWIEHDGGPQPVDDDVWVEIDEGHIDHDCGAARELAESGDCRIRKSQSNLWLICKPKWLQSGREAGSSSRVVAAREAVLDQLTSEAQAENMGYDNEPR